MSNDYFTSQAAKYHQADLVRAAEQHRLVKQAAEQAAESSTPVEKGGAARSHLRGVRLFGRSARPSAC